MKSRSPRTISSLAGTLILLAVSFSLAGEVQKIDDSKIIGEVVSFDGATLTIKSRDDKADSQPTSIDVRDLLQVRITGRSPTTSVATMPAEAAADSNDEPSGVMQGLLRLIGGGKRTAGPPADPSATPSAPSSTPTTQNVTLPDTWQLKLQTGDVLHGALREWTDQQIRIHHASIDAILEIPSKAIAEIWRDSPQYIAKASALKADAHDADVAYVISNGDVVAVTGVAIKVDHDALVFRKDGEDRKINLARIVGVVFAAQKSSDGSKSPPVLPPLFHQAFHFPNGDVICGKWKSLSDGAISLTTLWNQDLKFPATALTVIDFRNGRVVYLSDLSPSRVEQTPYFDRVIPWRRDTSLDGGPIVLVDGQHQHGLAVHSRCVLEFDLHGAFERFKTKVGFEQPGGEIGRATIRVLADGKALHEDADARGDEKPAELDLDLHGVNTLTLEVDFGRDQDVGDRVVWADARVVRSDVAK